VTRENWKYLQASTTKFYNLFFLARFNFYDKILSQFDNDLLNNKSRFLFQEDKKITTMKENFQAKSSNSITDVKHNREVLQIVLDTWKNNVVKLKLKMENLAYPVHLKSLWIVIGLVIICDKFLLSTSLDVVNLMLKYGVVG
jgi:hypothetical protein